MQRERVAQHGHGEESPGDPRRAGEHDHREEAGAEHHALLPEPPAAPGQQRQEGGEQGGGAHEGRRVLVAVALAPVGAEPAVAEGAGRDDGQHALPEARAARRELLLRHARPHDPGAAGFEELHPQARRQVPGRRQQPGSGQAGADRHGHGPAEQRLFPRAGRTRRQAGEGEGRREEREVEDRLRVPGAEDGEGRQGEQGLVAPGPRVVDPDDRVEQQRQERRCIRHRPVEPEEEPAAEPVGQTGGQGGRLRDPLPAQQKEGENEGDQHAHRGRDRYPCGHGEGEGEPDQRLERLRLRVAQQRLAGPGQMVPERPLAGHHRLPHPDQPGGDLEDQIGLQEVARWRSGAGRPDLAKRRNPGQGPEREQDAAGEERRTEEDQQRGPPHRPAADRDRVVPAPQRHGEQRCEEGHPEPGQETEGEVVHDGANPKPEPLVVVARPGSSPPDPLSHLPSTPRRERGTGGEDSARPALEFPDRSGQTLRA